MYGENFNYVRRNFSFLPGGTNFLNQPALNSLAYTLIQHQHPNTQYLTPNTPPVIHDFKVFLVYLPVKNHDK